jgi:uncharacterized protein (UPF0333 family)
MLRLKKSKKKGQALLEYVFLIAGIAFICLVAVAVFGHKLADQYAIAAGMLPGAHGEDNAPIGIASFVGTTQNAEGAIIGTGVVSWHDITGVTASGNGTTNGLQNNVAVAGGPATPIGGSVFVYEDEEEEEEE